MLMPQHRLRDTTITCKSHESHVTREAVVSLSLTHLHCSGGVDLFHCLLLNVTESLVEVGHTIAQGLNQSLQSGRKSTREKGGTTYVVVTYILYKGYCIIPTQYKPQFLFL